MGNNYSCYICDNNTTLENYNEISRKGKERSKKIAYLYRNIKDNSMLTESTIPPYSNIHPIFPSESTNNYDLIDVNQDDPNNLNIISPRKNNKNDSNVSQLILTQTVEGLIDVNDTSKINMKNISKMLMDKLNDFKLRPDEYLNFAINKGKDMEELINKCANNCEGAKDLFIWNDKKYQLFDDNKIELLKNNKYNLDVIDIEHQWNCLDNVYTDDIIWDLLGHCKEDVREKILMGDCCYKHLIIHTEIDCEKKIIFVKFVFLYKKDGYKSDSDLE